jgi:hypothetical protein
VANLLPKHGKVLLNCINISHLQHDFVCAVHEQLCIALVIKPQHYTPPVPLVHHSVAYLNTSVVQVLLQAIPIIEGDYISPASSAAAGFTGFTPSSGINDLISCCVSSFPCRAPLPVCTAPLHHSKACAKSNE